MSTSVVMILLLIAAYILWRVWPDDADRWHVDPAEKTLKRFAEIRLIGPDAPRFPVPAEELLTTMQAIALDDPRTWLLDGSVEEGMLTFTHRTLLVGYRDFTTLKAVDEPGGAKLAVLGRPGLNVHDWGVTKKRLDRWLLEAEQRLSN